MNKTQVKVWGGLGAKRSNGDTQWYQHRRIYDADFLALCITCESNPYYIMKKTKKIRKLTPKEMWRLMGFAKRNADGSFDDALFELASEVTTESMLVSEAGNSIVVNVLEDVFSQFMED